MATVLFVVKATVPKGQEEAFNRWYDEEHIPLVLQSKGAVSARRYKAILGEEKYQYMATYEFKDEATFWRMMESEHFRMLRENFDSNFGTVSERTRFAYTQIWP